ncbi:MAG: Hsp20 family protein [Stellaceae bacterium]
MPARSPPTWRRSAAVRIIRCGPSSKLTRAITRSRCNRVYAVYSERWHGRFERSMQLGPDVEPDRVNASFKNGVLTITVPKRPEAQRQVKRIPITAG